MNISFFKLSIGLLLICNISFAQELKTDIYVLKNFGRVLIPTNLDTLPQSIAKQAYIDNFFENASKVGMQKVEDLYNINVAKGILTNLDSNTFVFWPKRTLLSLIRIDPINKNDTAINNDFNLLPSIMFRKELIKWNSSEFKKILVREEKIQEYKTFFVDSYKKALELLFPTIDIKSINADYFLYQNSFPCFKISMNVEISDDNKSLQYTQELYSLFKDNLNYYLKFEFKTAEYKQWSSYQKYFFELLRFE